jgi:hypothetical protein
VKTREWVNHGQLEELLGTYLLLGRDCYLFTESATRSPKLDLLIQRIDAENQDQTHQATNGLADVELIKRLVWL